MTKLFKSMAVAGLLASGAMIAVPAMAAPKQAAASNQAVSGIAIASLDAVIANSSAFKTAQEQQKTTYKAQLDQAQQRQGQLEAQIKPMIDKFNADRNAAKPDQATLARQAQQIRELQQSGQQELQNILAPVALSEAYVNEQIEDKLDQAVKAAMTKQNVSLLLNPQAVLASNQSAYNLNQAILAELDALIPSAQLVPPAGWLPREMREQNGQRAAAAPAPAPSSTSTQPQGR